MPTPPLPCDHCARAGLVTEQRLVVAQVVKERRLLAAAGGSLAGALQLLNEPPPTHDGLPHAACGSAGGWQLPPEAAQACAANITALSLCGQVRSGVQMGLGAVLVGQAGGKCVCVRARACACVCPGPLIFT